MREEGLERDDLYITTKYDGGQVRKEAEASLNRVSLFSLLKHSL